MEFRDIDDRYSVTSTGEVYSKKREGTSGGFLRKSLTKTGYYTVMLSGDRRPKKVHRLVAKAFLPNPDNLPVVNHKDFNRLNNNVENLEWCTTEHNSKHSKEAGRYKGARGASSPCAKLTEEQVAFVRNNYRAKDKELGARALARRLGVNHVTILAVLSRRSWSDS